MQVLKDLGHTKVDCVIVELDEKREKALNVALNKIQGEWDKDKLAALLTELDGSEFDVTLTGFEAAEIDELMNAFYSREAVQDDFDVDEEHKEIKAKGAITKTGDIWKLGVHRLMCGDSTSSADFAKLMNGNRAQMSVTSPPYGVGKDYEYIHKYNLPYCKVYDMGYVRTGCVFCMFGVHLDKTPNRFQQLQKTHPQLWRYCMKPWDKGGLGMREVLEYMGVPYENYLLEDE